MDTKHPAIVNYKTTIDHVLSSEFVTVYTKEEIQQIFETEFTNVEDLTLMMLKIQCSAQKAVYKDIVALFHIVRRALFNFKRTIGFVEFVFTLALSPKEKLSLVHYNTVAQEAYPHYSIDPNFLTGLLTTTGRDFLPNLATNTKNIRECISYRLVEKEFHRCYSEFKIALYLAGYGNTTKASFLYGLQISLGLTGLNDLYKRLTRGHHIEFGVSIRNIKCEKIQKQLLSTTPYELENGVIGEKKIISKECFYSLGKYFPQKPTCTQLQVEEQLIQQGSLRFSPGAMVVTLGTMDQSNTWADISHIFARIMPKELVNVVQHYMWGCKQHFFVSHNIDFDYRTLQDAASNIGPQSNYPETTLPCYVLNYETGFRTDSGIILCDDPSFLRRKTQQQKINKERLKLLKLEQQALKVSKHHQNYKQFKREQMEIEDELEQLALDYRFDHFQQNC